MARNDDHGNVPGAKNRSPFRHRTGSNYTRQKFNNDSAVSAVGLQDVGGHQLQDQGLPILSCMSLWARSRMFSTSD